ncbi:mechanosensitive ion channel family protein [Lyngbya sp. PCC 8106]|uniref:mechanosensitive ion channel family protein n=1 Tax=Lyngbya sp. (strain PCC 8106) TaxID=313612 RepID=UPI0000EAA309|nr:mechanosensitive ion channel domain-containing protein [Lyngbya sp. PCC 8106]EAW37032.1 membrane protein, putative [Lyngbya sp. PCC 8106]
MVFAQSSASSLDFLTDAPFSILSIKIALIVGLVNFVGFFTFFIPRLIGNITARFASPELQQIYQQVIVPFQNQLGFIFLIVSLDAAILIAPIPQWLKWMEVPLGVVVTISLGWQINRIFKQFFQVYWLDNAVKKRRKLNSEILIVIQAVANILIVIIVVFVFAQTHQINVIGLLASVGVGGLAVAFAAQKTLEQLLGGIVLYLDRPFVIDDYIHLPDRTFGRVESIGWRSTKIRTSGKGSLVIIPNNILTQVSIENLTNAKKIISLIHLMFYRLLSEEEKAFIRQIVLDSTQEIFGIDHRITQVSFKEIASENSEDAVLVEAQVTFFILGSGDVSMDFRTHLLEIAEQNITQRLQDVGIEFDIEEKRINVTSPVNI